VQQDKPQEKNTRCSIYLAHKIMDFKANKFYLDFLQSSVAINGFRTFVHGPIDKLSKGQARHTRGETTELANCGNVQTLCRFLKRNYHKNLKKKQTHNCKTGCRFWQWRVSNAI